MALLSILMEKSHLALRIGLVLSSKLAQPAQAEPLLLMATETL
jgi:hypothetical protein